jgi:hypothetical protein
VTTRFGATASDVGTDLVANTVTFSPAPPTVVGAGPAPRIATPSGSASKAGELVVGRLPVPVTTADIASGSRVFDLAIPSLEPGHETRELEFDRIAPPLEIRTSQDHAGPGAPVSREEVAAFLACAPLGEEFAPSGCAPTAPPAYGSALDTERASEVARAYRELLGDSPHATAGREALARAAEDPKARSAPRPARRGGSISPTWLAFSGRSGCSGSARATPRCAAICSRRSLGRSGRPSSTPSGSAPRSTRARWGCRSSGSASLSCDRGSKAASARLLSQPADPPRKDRPIPVSRSRRVPRFLLALGTLWFGAASARALSFEPTYRVSEIVVEYALDSPQQIPIDQVLDLEVGLRRAEDAYVAPRPVDRTVRMRLSALPRDSSFGASALLHINQHIVASFNRRGINGVIVAVPDIEEGTGRDLRAPGDTVLHLRIWTGQVTRVSSIADGERFGGLSVDERTNNAAHAWIRERSPVRPGGPRGLLSISALEDYAAEISRHPGRRMSVEVTPGPRAGTTDVNLRIAESKTWYAYAQYANTGTSTTTKNRERFGYTNNQLLGRDDILSLDYTTGDFDQVHAVSGSYSSPFTLASPQWRYALGGGYSRFDAQEAGFTATDVEGEDANAGAEISRQLFQHHELFVDAVAGARWQHVEVENHQVAGVTLNADIDYAVPHAGLRLERNTTTSTLRGRVGVLGGLTDTSKSDLASVRALGTSVTGPPELDVLGNARADDDFALTSFDASWSFYLEPVLDPYGWSDANQKRGGALVHEIAFLARGQWAMNYRLIPEFQQVVGGFTTVRGYKQSAAVGDDLLLGSVEYRFHLPRLFSPDPTPPELPGMGLFRLRPTHVWDTPDWDLIFRVFSDAAYVDASHPLASEKSDTLVSAGGARALGAAQLDAARRRRSDAPQPLRARPAGRGHACARGRDAALLGWTR